MQKCAICKAEADIHNGWGFISCCCGSFFCANCAKSMTTRDVIIYESDTSNEYSFKDTEHYYCVICHNHDPVFISNSTRHKNITNIQTYHIVDQFMDTSDLKDSAHVDYYFKMFIDGFKPLYHEGRTIICELEDQYKIKDVENDIDRFKYVLQLFSKDQQATIAIDRINETLKELEIRPFDLNIVKPYLLIYGCPEYMKQRLNQYFQVYSKDKNSNLYGLNLLYKKSLGELIGLHQNILGILIWENPQHSDEIQQLIGRIVRLNNWNNPIYFYITCCGLNKKNIDPSN
jgi:hypothetical protein